MNLLFKVLDTFTFSDGRTVFVGIVENGSKFIESQKCEMLVDGKSMSIIDIEGEMITESLLYRSISTKDNVKIKPDYLKTWKSSS